MIERRDLFDFMQRQVKAVADQSAEKTPQAFARWFANLYFQGVIDIAIHDGGGDGKVDAIVTCRVGSALRYYIMNTKYTSEYDKRSPVAFYDEITRYWQAFENKGNRAAYLDSVVREDMRAVYKKMFRLYDEGSAKLYFVTNCRTNDAQQRSVRNYSVETLHLEDILQHVVDHMENAMPETEPLVLSGVSNVLTPQLAESEVPTSIVFARLVDFIRYMEDDPLDLLFARNVRLDLEDTEPNRDIRRTFRELRRSSPTATTGSQSSARIILTTPGSRSCFFRTLAWSTARRPFTASEKWRILQSSRG